MNKFLKQLSVAATIVGAVATANAVPTIRISDGLGDSVTIADGGAAVIAGAASATGGGDLNGLAGVVTFSGTVGAWVLNVDTGTSKPFLGTAAKPRMDLHFLASGGIGTLSVDFSDDFFGPTVGNALANIGGTTDGTVKYTTLGSAANVLFAGGVLTAQGPFGPIAFGGSATGASLAALGNPYALTQEVDITHTLRSQITSGDALLSVPDAGTTMMLLGSSLTLLGFFGRSRKVAVKI